MRGLIKSNEAKTRKLSELSRTEKNRFAKLNGMLDELRCQKKVLSETDVNQKGI